MGGILRRLFPGWRAEPPRPEGYLTWAEIEAKYPGEWVLLDEPTVDRREEVTGGILLLHSKDRDEYDRQLVEQPIRRHFAALYIRDPNAVAEDVVFDLPRVVTECEIDSTPPADSSTSPPSWSGLPSPQN